MFFNEYGDALAELPNWSNPQYQFKSAIVRLA